MVLNPGVQSKAQEELDRVVGPNRLPEFSDEPELPYLRAICKEVLRWQPAVPLGIPHRNIQDDEYRGMFIPKGSTIIVNQWHLLRNEKEFGSRTDEFRPERFLEADRKDFLPAFGFGRRICPGRYMVENTLFIVISSMLHTFKIERAKDEMGREIPISRKYTTALTSHPEPFECKIVPRSEAAEKLIATVGEADN